MEFCSTPRRTIYKTLALMLICAVGLMGCFGGSSSSDDNGEEEAPSNGDNGDNRDSEPDNGDSEPQGAALIYEDTETVNFGQDRRIGLYMVDPESPTSDPTAIEPLAQDNYDAAQGLDLPSSTLELPRTDTLPLAVFDADLDGTELSDARYESVVYNTAEGELYRIDVDEGSGEASRFSNEENASAVCAAEVISDYVDPDDSVLVYQVAKDDDCADTRLKAVAVGAGTETNPVTLVEDVSDNESLKDSFGGMAFGVYENSRLTHVLANEGNEIVAFDLGDSSVETAWDGAIGDFRDVGLADAEQTGVFFVDDGLRTFDAANNEFNSLGRIIFGDHLSITINDALYVMDGDQNEILRIDTSADDPVSVINNDWSATSFEWIAASSTHLAWAQPGSSLGTSVVRSIELADPENSTEILGEGDYTFVSWSDIAAEDENSDGWFFYRDNDEETIEGVEISGASSTFGPIENAEWIGETWATTASSTEVLGLSQPEYIVYTSDGELKAREATDPTGGTEVTFPDAPDELRFTSLGSYGAKSLMSQRQAQQNDNRPDIWYLDVSDGASIERITDNQLTDSIPLPWF